jgi:hypothetical protein
VPEKPNEVAFDSFICFDNILYIFQFTVSEEHSYNDKLISRFAEFSGVPNSSRWRFIFVIPQNVKGIKCPFPKTDELQKLNPFSSQIVMKDLIPLMDGEISKSLAPPAAPLGLATGSSSQIPQPSNDSNQVAEPSEAEETESLPQIPDTVTHVGEAPVPYRQSQRLQDKATKKGKKRRE